MTDYLSFSSAATKRFAKKIAREILGQKRKSAAVVVALTGGLSAGKTTFAQGFAAGLGIRERVSSPTFILMRVAKPKRKKFDNFVHIDAYRAETKDFLKLGLKKLLADPRNIILVEWAEKLKKTFPKSAIWISFSHKKNRNERTITVNKK